MPVGIGSTQITGISVVANPTDAANKQYVDSSSGGLPSIDGNENEFLFTDGSTATWQPIQGYQEYTTAGNYTFTVPSQAKELFIEATGAGGGGAPGSATTPTNYVSRGEFWFLRTSGTTNNFTGNGNVGNPVGSYGLGFYVMGTSSGTIFASTDSITWVARTSGFGTSIIWSVNYGSNIFISTCQVVGTGMLRTSTDTIHWILRTTGSTISIITTISTDNNFHLIADEGGRIASSTDGITWNTRTTPSSGSFSTYSRAYSASPSTNYLFAGNTGIVASTDGIVWTLRTSGQGSTTFYCGTYGNGIYLFGTSGGTLIASTDTIVWTSRNYPSGSANQMSDVIFGNNIYIVNQFSNRYLITSTNSIVWIVRTSPAVSTNYRAGIFGNSIFVYGSDSGRIIASTIPSGTAGSGGGGGASLGSIISRSNISGSTLNVNVGSGGTSGTAGAASTVSWTSPGGNFSITANGGSAGVNTFLSTSNIAPGGAGGTVTVSNNYVYSSAGTAGGNGGYFESSTNNMQGYTGTDASTATSVYQTTGGGGGASSLFDGQFGTFGGTINYYGNTYQNSKTIPALMNGTSSLSISGLSYGNGGNGGGAQHGAVVWVLRTSGFGATAYGIGYGSGVYVIVGATGNLRSSTDTITWTLRTSGFGTSSINEIISDGTNLVAVSNGGAIRASTNGIQWTIRTSPTSNNLGNLINTGPAAIYANNLYLVGGNSGTYVVSTNSIVWTLRTTGLGANNGWGIAYGSDLTEKYLMSSNTLLASSTDNISWTLRTSGFALNSLQYFGGRYYGFTNGNVIRTSTNGIEWSTQVTVAHALYSSAVSNNSLITGGSTGSVYSSTNGISWVLRTSNVGSVNAFAFGYGNGLFLASYGAGAQVIVADSNINGGNGGAGTKGGGGGGGGYNLATNTVGTGGTGGDGYVRISWQ